ncbi:MAG: aspartate aminotransferase family protein [Verrucomicrobia bacterium]|nr:aspartate aminotransferase family protein [Verrucomicrobiota bacterium]
MKKSEEIATRYGRFVMPTYAQHTALVKGKGTRVWDADGMVYLDFASGISVVNVGHCHPRVVEAIQRQAGELMHSSNLFFNDNQAKLAERLSRLALEGKCFFGNSGAEANEGLIKLARLWGHEQGRYEIITMTNSFHGRTLATAAATGQIKVQKGFDPMPEGFSFAEFNNLESVAMQVGERTVAIMLEAVQGEGGVVVADEAFMKGIRALCDEKGLLMLCDEVQCGMGRTGHWFGFEASGVQPDACSMAKGLGSGFPIGAVVSTPKLSDVFQPGTHASTFGGSPLACAAALATLDVIEEEDLVRRAGVVGKVLRARLAELVSKYEHVTAVRGAGMMLGLVLDQESKPLTGLLADKGLLTLATANNVVRLLPPLNVKDGEIDEAFDILDEALDEWHGGKDVLSATA